MRTPVFTAALPAVVETWRQPQRPVTEGWARAAPNTIYTVERCSAVRKGDNKPSGVSQKKLRTIRLHSHVGAKLKTGTDSSVTVTRGPGVGEERVKGAKSGDGRGFDFGWWAPHAIYRSCVMDTYTGNP